MPESNGQLARAVSRDLLPFVERPGQYIGGEVGAVRKKWDDAAVRFCLAFPDTYAIGMSHLGSAIIYHLLNARDGTLCERTFAPWVDAQRRMREAGIPLFSWESRRPVRQFDIVGFSLQYEMLYTNVLSMLDLAGIPVLASERSEDDPLILGGGPGVNNPEPMAAFLDLAFIGDAEETLPRLTERLARLKAGGANRSDRILTLAASSSACMPPASSSRRGTRTARLPRLRRRYPACPSAR
jgi:hypothetical protein